MPPTETQQWTVSGPSGFTSALHLTSAALPPLGPYSVLIKLAYASLNYRDLIIPQGLYPFPMANNVVPGSDGSGTVISTGSSVTRFSAGDRVLTHFGPLHQTGDVTLEAAGQTLGGGVDGVLREYAVFEESGLVRCPHSLSLQQGATLPCAALTSWNALYGLQSRAIVPGQWVLTEGTGGVSVFAVQVRERPPPPL